jgi:hypothetical protein
LEKAGLIGKLDPHQSLPDGLPDREQKLVRRQPDVPIWLPHIRFYIGSQTTESIFNFLKEAPEEIELELKRMRTIN